MKYNEAQLRAIARSSYEAYRSYCLSLGDERYPIWNEAVDWLRAQTIADVYFVVDHLAITPEKLHERWFSRLLRDGWRYKPGRADPEAKTHPSLLPWSE